MADIESYFDIGHQFAEEYGVDPAFVRQIMTQESGGKPGLTSSAGARGPMQLMPGTAKELGVNINDPTDNTRGGVMYLQRMLRKYNGDQRLAAMAYNWGPGNVDAYLRTGRGAKGQEMPRETQNYIQAFPDASQRHRQQNNSSENEGGNNRMTQTNSQLPILEPMPTHDPYEGQQWNSGAISVSPFNASTYNPETGKTQIDMSAPSPGGVAGQGYSRDGTSFRGKIHEGGLETAPSHPSWEEQYKGDIDASFNTALSNENMYKALVRTANGKGTTDAGQRKIAEAALARIQAMTPEELKEAGVTWDLEEKPASSRISERAARAASNAKPVEAPEDIADKVQTNPEVAAAETSSKIAESLPGAKEALGDLENDKNIPGPKVEEFSVEYEDSLLKTMEWTKGEISRLEQRLAAGGLTDNQKEELYAQIGEKQAYFVSLTIAYKDYKREQEIRGSEGGFLSVLKTIGLAMGAGGFAYNGNAEGMNSMIDMAQTGKSRMLNANEQAELSRIGAGQNALMQSGQGRAQASEGAKFAGGQQRATQAEGALHNLKFLNAQTQADLTKLVQQHNLTIDQLWQNAEAQSLLARQAADLAMETAEKSHEFSKDQLAYMQELRRKDVIWDDDYMASVPEDKKRLIGRYRQMTNNELSYMERAAFDAAVRTGEHAANAAVDVGKSWIMRPLGSDRSMKNVYFRFDQPGMMGNFMNYAMTLGLVSKLTQPNTMFSDEQCKDIVEAKKKVAFSKRPKDVKELWKRVSGHTREWK